MCRTRGLAASCCGAAHGRSVRQPPPPKQGSHGKGMYVSVSVCVCVGGGGAEGVLHLDRPEVRAQLVPDRGELVRRRRERPPAIVSIGAEQPRAAADGGAPRTAAGGQRRVIPLQHVRAASPALWLVVRHATQSAGRRRVDDQERERKKATQNVLPLRSHRLSRASGGPWCPAPRWAAAPGSRTLLSKVPPDVSKLPVSKKY